MSTRWDRYLNKMKNYFFEGSDLFEFSLCYMILPNLLSLLFSRLIPILQVLGPTYLQRWGGASNIGSLREVVADKSFFFLVYINFIFLCTLPRSDGVNWRED